MQCWSIDANRLLGVCLREPVRPGLYTESRSQDEIIVPFRSVGFRRIGLGSCLVSIDSIDSHEMGVVGTMNNGRHAPSRTHECHRITQTA